MHSHVFITCRTGPAPDGDGIGLGGPRKLICGAKFVNYLLVLNSNEYAVLVLATVASTTSLWFHMRGSVQQTSGRTEDDTKR